MRVRVSGGGPRQHDRVVGVGIRTDDLLREQRAEDCGRRSTSGRSGFWLPDDAGQLLDGGDRAAAPLPAQLGRASRGRHPTAAQARSPRGRGGRRRTPCTACRRARARRAVVAGGVLADAVQQLHDGPRLPGLPRSSGSSRRTRRRRCGPFGSSRSCGLLAVAERSAAQAASGQSGHDGSDESDVPFVRDTELPHLVRGVLVADIRPGCSASPRTGWSSS